MVEITANQTKAFTPAVDTLLQNVGEDIVRYHENIDEPVQGWGKLYVGKHLEIPANITIHFRCRYDCVLAEHEIK